MGVAGGILSYGKNREALTKDPAVFALRELVLVDAEGDLVIKLRFPERYLTLKYESEELRNLWFKVFTEEAQRLGAKIAQAAPVAKASKEQVPEKQPEAKAADAQPATAPAKAHEGQSVAPSDENASTGTTIEAFALTDEPSPNRPPSPRSMLASGSAKASAAAAKWGTVDDDEDRMEVQAPYQASNPAPVVPPRPEAAVLPPSRPRQAAQPPGARPASGRASGLLRPGDTRLQVSVPPESEASPFAPVFDSFTFGSPKIRVVDAKASNTGTGDILDNEVPPADENFLDDWDSDDN